MPVWGHILESGRARQSEFQVASFEFRDEKTDQGFLVPSFEFRELRAELEPGPVRFRLRAGREKVDFQGLAGVGQGLEGIGQEVVLEIPLGGRHQAINHFGSQGHIHFEHEAEKAGEFPAGLEEQFEILAGPGPPDDAQDHFHDEVEFAE